MLLLLFLLFLCCVVIYLFIIHQINYEIMICIILLFFFLYIYNYIVTDGGYTTLLSSHDMKTSIDPIIIYKKINTTKSTISLWVYINSWNSLEEKIILYLPGKYKLYLSTIAPILSLQIYTNKGVKNIIITNDFPIQKWSQISINFDNLFVDCYLEGKLLKSIQLDSLQSDSSGNMLYIGKSHDILLNDLKRWTLSQSSQSIYNDYLRGQGGNFLFNTISSYGISLNIIKNNIITNTMQLY